MSYTPLSPEAFARCRKLPVMVVLDNVRSMHNVGAVFRLADVFAIAQVCLCGITPTPPHRAIHQAALGAEHTVDWTYFKDTVQCLTQLQDQGYTAVAIEQTHDAQALTHFAPIPTQPYALVFGHEVFGVGTEVVNCCAHALQIPQYGTKQSLNVSTSVGILLWEFSRHIRD